LCGGKVEFMVCIIVGERERDSKKNENVLWCAVLFFFPR
jgi:hypothetical protein